MAAFLQVGNYYVPLELVPLGFYSQNRDQVRIVNLDVDPAVTSRYASSVYHLTWSSPDRVVQQLQSLGYPAGPPTQWGSQSPPAQPSSPPPASSPPPSSSPPSSTPPGGTGSAGSSGESYLDQYQQLVTQYQQQAQQLMNQLLGAIQSQNQDPYGGNVRPLPSGTIVPFSATQAAPNEQYLPQVPAWAATQFDLWLRSLPVSDEAKSALGKLLVPLYLDYARLVQGYNPESFPEYLQKLDVDELLWRGTPEIAAAERLRTVDPALAGMLGKHYGEIGERYGIDNLRQWAQQASPHEILAKLSSFEPDFAYKNYLANVAQPFDSLGRQRLSQAFDVAYKRWQEAVAQGSTMTFLDFLEQMQPEDWAIAAGPTEAGRFTTRVRWLTY